MPGETFHGVCYNDDDDDDRSKRRLMKLKPGNKRRILWLLKNIITQKLFRSVESELASGITSDATCTPTAIQLMVLPTQRLRTRLPVRIFIEERSCFREMPTSLANHRTTMKTQWKPTFQEGWSGPEPSSTTTRRSAGTTRTRLTDHQSGCRTTCQVLCNHIVSRNWNCSLVWVHYQVQNKTK